MNVGLVRRRKGGAEKCILLSCQPAVDGLGFCEIFFVMSHRRSVWEGHVELKLLQHLLLSRSTDKRVLFKEATSLWET